MQLFIVLISECFHEQSTVMTIALSAIYFDKLITVVYSWVTVETNVQSACAAHVQRKSVDTVAGDSVLMKCPSETSTWSFAGNEVTLSDKVHITTRGDLILLNVGAFEYQNLFCTLFI